MTEKTSGHGGDINRLAREAGIAANRILDFSANINPLGPPAWFRSLINDHIDSLVHYPDPDCSALKEIIARRSGVDREEILVGNGSTELLFLIPRILPVSAALIPVPAYIDYAKAARVSGAPVRYHYLDEANGFRLELRKLEPLLTGGELVILGQPNNPTGLTFDPMALREMAARHPNVFFMVDEAFADFVEGLESLITNRPSNVIVLKSFTKFYAIPGLRLGAAFLDREWAEKTRKILPLWTVNTLAQRVGEAALRDVEYEERSRLRVSQQRDLLTALLTDIDGLAIYPGTANFLFIRLDRHGPKAGDLAKRLLSQGIAIRVCDNYQGLDERFFRVAVRPEQENRKLATALRSALS